MHDCCLCAFISIPIPILLSHLFSSSGVRRGPLRPEPLTIDGVTLSVVAPKLNVPKLPSGWNSKKILAFIHHELGGSLGGGDLAEGDKVVMIGRTREQVEAEAAAKRDDLELRRAGNVVVPDMCNEDLNMRGKQ